MGRCPLPERDTLNLSVIAERRWTLKIHHSPGSFKVMENEHARAAVKVLVSFLGLWFVAAFIGGLLGIFYQPGEPPLFVGIFLLIPIIGFTLTYRICPLVQQALKAIPLWLITLAHVWRFVGLGFVAGAIAGLLPGQFGYPEGLGDVIAAALCLPLASAIRRQSHSPRLRAAFIAWNIFGLIDLLSAISLGILYSPSTFGLLRKDISTGLLTTFPINLIPTFFLPLFILLHVLALVRSKELAGPAVP
jgi:hypothetical protein